MRAAVQDYPPGEFKNNVMALANIAKFFKLPTILTTSFEQGPNGPILPELKEMFPEAPFISRPGQINAWDNEAFVTAVQDTGRRQLMIAGVVTDVCVAFLTLSALEAGYDVLRDEGEAYTQKLMQAGLSVTAVRYLGTIHDFVMLNAIADTPAARSAIGLANRALQEALGNPSAVAA